MAKIRKKTPFDLRKMIRPLLIMGVGCFVAFLSATSTIANIVQSANPDLALRMVPNNSAALAAKADGEILANGVNMNAARVAELSRRALKSQPLNARALRLLGYAADKQGDAGKAKALMLLSGRVSRRDLGAQLWLIEDAVRRNDIALALVHYDNALRTRRDSYAILFPVLTEALALPEVRAAIVPYVKRNPEWLNGFYGYAIVNGKRPDSISALLEASGGMPQGKSFAGYETALIQNLAAKSAPSAVERYVLSLKGFKPDILKTVAFGPDTIGAKWFPVTWDSVQSSAVSGQFIKTNSGNFELKGNAAPGERGVIARKLLFLPAGIYQAEIEVARGILPNGITILPSVRCLGENTQTRITSDAISGPRLSVTFEITGTCQGQYAEIVVANTPASDNAAVIVENFRILTK